MTKHAVFSLFKNMKVHRIKFKGKFLKFTSFYDSVDVVAEKLFFVQWVLLH